MILIFGLSVLFITNQFLQSQEQIKKDELELQKTQKQISDCKYLLANQDLLLPPSIGKTISDSMFKAIKEYASSAIECRTLLRNLPDSH